MKKLALILVSLLIFATFSFASGAADDSSTEGSAAEMGKALGLYPEYFQFASLTEMEEVTGIKLTEFNEAPELAAMVAKGELPPVEERLPEQPLVIVRNEIGTYGGTLNTAHDGTSTDVILTVNKFMEEMPYTWHPDYDYPQTGPNLLMESELRDGGKEFIWKLRKGLKWSDGAPMTADDFIFWYDAVAMDEDLSPNGINSFKLQGEMGKMEKLGDFSLRITFNSPFGYFPESIAIFRPGPFIPKHYFKDLHPKYASKADLDKMMMDKGYTDWVSMWNGSRTHWAVENPDQPHIRPWIMTTDGRAPVNRMIRNPYYWKIDTAGNQLPYINEIESVLVGDQEAKKLKVISGDVDYIYGEMLGLTAETFSLLKQYESQGKYEVRVSAGAGNNQGYINFNMAHKDPVLRDIFNEKDFRIALSIAQDREEINEVVHRGSYIPSQISPNTDWGFNDPLFRQYTEYDPDKANELLDGIGLEWNSAKTVRLRPDGKPLQMVMVAYTARGPFMMEWAEMVQQYFAAVGVDLTLKPHSEGTISKTIADEQYDLVFHQAFGGMPGYPAALRNELIPLSPDSWPITPAWAKWIVTEGAQGIEPPDEVKRLAEIPDLFRAEADPKVREEISKEIFEIHMDKMWSIGGMNKNPLLTFSPYANRLKGQVGTTWAVYHHVASAWWLEDE